MEKVDIMLEPLKVMLVQVGEFLPRLLLAVVVLIAGWLLAGSIKFAVTKGLRAINFHVLTERAGIDGFLKQGGIATDTTAILGLIVYWVVILAVLRVAFNGLGLTYTTELLGRVVAFLLRVIVAVLIIAFGTYFARFIGEVITSFCRSVETPDADLLGSLARYAILAFVLVIALEQMNLGGDIVRESFLIVLAGVALALSIAFGLGGQRWPAGLLERWRRKDKQERPAQKHTGTVAMVLS
jgi:mechanosensitive ion channel-like protein